MGDVIEMPKQVKISVADALRRVIAERGAHAPTCPICTGDQWDAVQPLYLSTAPAVSATPGDGPVSVAPLVCKNCGFIHLFSAQHLVEIVTPGGRR